MESRIRRNIYILIGVAVFLLVAMIVAWYFLLIRPQKQQLANVKSQLQTRKGIADRLPQAQEEQKKAEDRLVYLKSQIGFFRNVRYRHLSFGDIGPATGGSPTQKAERIAAWRRWLTEYFSDYGLALKNTLQDYATDAGVVINTASKVNAPPKAPEEVAIPPYGIFKPTGDAPLGVTITGPLSNIIRFFDRINTSGILMVIGTIKLENAAGGTAGGGAGGAGATAVALSPGVSPRITASFTLTPYLLASGPTVDAPRGGAAAAPAAESTAPVATDAAPDPAESGGTASGP